MQAFFSPTDLFLAHVFNILQVTDHSEYPYLHRFLTEMQNILQKQYNFEQVFMTFLFMFTFLIFVVKTQS